MFWLKLFWIEMIVFPLILLYLLSTIPHQSILQLGARAIYVVVFLCAVSGYIYTWNKKRKLKNDS